jgi:hypothetical protein
LPFSLGCTAFVVDVEAAGRPESGADMLNVFFPCSDHRCPGYAKDEI